MASIPRFNVTGRYRESEESSVKNGSRFFASGDSPISNLTRTDDNKSRPNTATSQCFIAHKRRIINPQAMHNRHSRPFRNLLPNFLQRLRSAGGSWGNVENSGRASSSRSSAISGDGTNFTDTMSMFSVPASYSGVYYDRVGDDSDESGSFLTVSDLDSYRDHAKRPDSYYAEYANIEDSNKGRNDGDKTPTNSPTPKPSPKIDNLKVKDSSLSPKKVARLESLRDTHRRMKTLTQFFPTFALDPPSETTEEPDEDAKLGFANIPDQMHRKAVKKGFNFTLMIAGESGLGKSTLVNSLFMQDLYKSREPCDASDMIKKVTKIEKRQIELDERGVKLRLTIVDTPGFNDAVNAEDCWKPIEDYIDGTFEQYFKDECGLNRKNIQDNRVHCCLYFISPYGHGCLGLLLFWVQCLAKPIFEELHPSADVPGYSYSSSYVFFEEVSRFCVKRMGLRQVDVEFMRRLQNKVNIVPVIAKADALTASELRNLKERIMSDLDRYKIDIYRLPECDSDEEEEIKRLDKEIKAIRNHHVRSEAEHQSEICIDHDHVTNQSSVGVTFPCPQEKAVLPFAVIGSNCVIEGEGGKRVRGRQYPWGVVEVENPKHCDFTKLRIFLLKQVFIS
ncbi:unnamed protein product [Rodentolepis nana]|uniref:Septin-type G domain-containing protein n=1 Tax=Rodentolepis nana TaxID=102285 RepID=A0A0R3TPS8_RODNA|nr:unnamed protein product [Rodentolepis nana]